MMMMVYKQGLERRRDMARSRRKYSEESGESIETGYSPKELVEASFRIVPSSS